MLSEKQQGPRLTQETIFDESQNVTQSTLNSTYDPNKPRKKFVALKQNYEQDWEIHLYHDTLNQ